LVEQLPGERFSRRMKSGKRRAAVGSELAHRVSDNTRAPNLAQRVAADRTALVATEAAS